MRLQNLKRRIEGKERKILTISFLGFGMILFLFLVPIFLVNLIIGVLCFVVAIDYNKRKKKDDKKRITIFILCIIGIAYLGCFLALTARTSEKMEINGEGEMEYTHEGYLYEGRSWFFDKDLRDSNGQVQTSGTVRYPTKTSIYHELSASERDDNDEYEINVKSNIEFDDHEIEMKVYGSDDKDWAEKTHLFDVNIDMEKSKWWQGEDITYRWVNEDDETCDGDRDYLYYYFVFEAEIEEDQDLDWQVTWTKIQIKAEEGGEWGFTETEDPSVAGLMGSIFEEDSSLFILVIFEMAIIVVFTVSFILMWVTQQLKHFDKFMMILTLLGILLLMVLMVYSGEIFIIGDLLEAIDTYPDMFGIWESMKMLIRIIGMIIAFFLWSWTVGNALALCWLMYYIFKKFIGDMELEKLFSRRGGG